MRETDLLDRPLGEVDRQVLDVYERLRALAGREDVPPCVAANARFALAAMWQVVNDLALDDDLAEDLI